MPRRYKTDVIVVTWEAAKADQRLGDEQHLGSLLHRIQEYKKLANLGEIAPPLFYGERI
jgi:hypothetical protein